MLVADGVAALPGALALADASRRPLLAALLLGASLLLRPPGRAERLAGVLDELPAVLGRIAVVWLALAALTAAYEPRHALPAGVLLPGFLLHAAAACAARGAVYRRRRTALAHRPSAALVVGPAGTAQRVAAAVLRHPRCGVRPVGVVTGAPDGGEGLLPVLTTGEEVRRAIVQNGVREVLVVRGAAAAHEEVARVLAESGCAVWEIAADPGPEQPAAGTGVGPGAGTAADSAAGPGGERLAGFPAGGWRPRCGAAGRVRASGCWT